MYGGGSARSPAVDKKWASALQRFRHPFVEEIQRQCHMHIAKVIFGARSPMIGIVHGFCLRADIDVVALENIDKRAPPLFAQAVRMLVPRVPYTLAERWPPLPRADGFQRGTLHACMVFFVNWFNLLRDAGTIIIHGHS